MGVTFQGVGMDATRAKALRMPARTPTFTPSEAFKNASIHQFRHIWEEKSGVHVSDWDNAPQDVRMLLDKTNANNQGDRGAPGVRSYKDLRAIEKALARGLSGHMHGPLFPGTRDAQGRVTDVTLDSREFRAMLECPAWSGRVLDQIGQIGMNVDIQRAEMLGFDTTWTKSYVSELTKALASPEILDLPQFSEVNPEDNQRLQTFALQALDSLEGMRDSKGKPILAREARPSLSIMREAVRQSGQLKPLLHQQIREYRAAESGTQEKAEGARALAFAAGFLGGDLALPRTGTIAVHEKYSTHPERKRDYRRLLSYLPGVGGPAQLAYDNWMRPTPSSNSPWNVTQGR
jgi:hypothetical protein